MKENRMQHVNYDDTSLSLEMSDNDQKIREAMGILYRRMKNRKDLLNDSSVVKRYLLMHYSGYERECFTLVLLDSQHRLIKCVDLCYGTIDAAHIYPREVAKAVLYHNAAAVICAHNHPSGIPEPSQPDCHITARLQETLALLDVPILDHFVCGDCQVVSFAERGLL